MRVQLRGRQLLSRGAFSIWATLLFGVLTFLTAAHLYTLPKPNVSDPRLVRALNALRTGADQDRWLAVHVLYAECRCSRRILEHLATSPRPKGAREKLLLVGELDELKATVGRVAARGLAVVKTTPVELRDHFHVQAAPLLLVLEPHGSIRYSGGYTERKQGLEIRDTDIIDGLASNQSQSELPLFGCSVSKQLQQLLDPLALSAPR